MARTNVKANSSAGGNQKRKTAKKLRQKCGIDDLANSAAGN
jgi:hypothetical protein